MTNHATFCVLGHYFKNKRSRVFGCVMTAGSVAAMILPHAFNFFLQYQGLGCALLFLAAGSLHIVAASALYRPDSFYLPKSKPFHGVTVVLTKFNVKSGADSPRQGLDNLPSENDRKCNGIESIQSQSLFRISGTSVAVNPSTVNSGIAFLNSLNISSVTLGSDIGR